MPEWLEIPLGILLGAAVVAGAVILAIAPELRMRRRKSWLPNPSGRRQEPPDYANLSQS